jgi:hypothetical protein
MNGAKIYIEVKAVGRGFEVMTGYGAPRVLGSGETTELALADAARNLNATGGGDRSDVFVLGKKAVNTLGHYLPDELPERKPASAPAIEPEPAQGRPIYINLQRVARHVEAAWNNHIIGSGRDDDAALGDLARRMVRSGSATPRDTFYLGKTPLKQLAVYMGKDRHG